MTGGKFAAAALAVLVPAGAWWATGKLPETPRPSALESGMALAEEGLRHHEAKRHIQAGDSLQMALIKLSQDRSQDRAVAARLEARLLLVMGDSHIALGNWSRAAEAFERAARLLRDNPEPGSPDHLRRARRGAKIARDKERRKSRPQEAR